MDDIFIPLQVKKPIKVDSFRDALSRLKKTLEVPQQNMLRACWWDNSSNDVDSIEEAIGSNYSFSIKVEDVSSWTPLSATLLHMHNYHPLDPDVSSETVDAYNYKNVEGSQIWNYKNLMICMKGLNYVYNESFPTRQITITLYAHIPDFRDHCGNNYRNYSEREKIYQDTYIKNFPKLVFWMSWHDVQVIKNTNTILYLEYGKFEELRKSFLMYCYTLEDEKYLKEIDTEIIPDGPFYDDEKKSGVCDCIYIRLLKSNFDNPNAKIIKSIEEKFKSIYWIWRLAFEVRKHGSFISDSINENMYFAKLEDRYLVAYLIKDIENGYYDKVEWYWFNN